MPPFTCCWASRAGVFAGLAGAAVGIALSLRNVCFVSLPVGRGRVRSQCGRCDAALALSICGDGGAGLGDACAQRWLLSRFFGFDRRAALLASAPGHLSFGLGDGGEGGDNVARISTTQSVRLLSLTLVVPFVALAMGVDLGGTIVPDGAVMGAITLAVMAACRSGRAAAGRIRVPAPMLIGPMLCRPLRM